MHHSWGAGQSARRRGTTAKCTHRFPAISSGAGGIQRAWNQGASAAPAGAPRAPTACPPGKGPWPGEGHCSPCEHSSGPWRRRCPKRAAAERSACLPSALRGEQSRGGWMGREGGCSEAAWAPAAAAAVRTRAARRRGQRLEVVVSVQPDHQAPAAVLVADEGHARLAATAAGRGAGGGGGAGKD